MKAILLISHGSCSSKTVDEIKNLVVRLQTQNVVDLVEYAFLELADPSIPEGIKLCIEKGATEVEVLLNFLNSGRHVDKDIPKIVKDTQKQFPAVQISISKPVGQHPDIINLFLDMIK